MFMSNHLAMYSVEKRSLQMHQFLTKPWLFCKNSFIALFIWKAEQEREARGSKNRNACICKFSPKWPWGPRLNRAEGRRLNLHPGHPWGGRAPSTWAFPSQVHRLECWAANRAAGTWTGIHVRCQHCSHQLTLGHHNAGPILDHSYSDQLQL